MVVLFHQHEESVGVQQIPQAVSDGGNLLYVLAHPGCDDDDRLPPYAVGVRVFDQLVVELLLLRGKVVLQKLAGHVQAGPLLQEPPHDVQVARGSSGISEGAGVLIHPQQEQGSLDEGEVQPRLGDLLHQQGGGGAHLLPAVAHLRVQLRGRGMVVNDAPRHIGGQALQGGKALRVHQDHPLDGLGGQVLGPEEGQFLPVEHQEAAQVAVGPLRQHRHRIGVQLGGPQQGGESIKVGVLVGKNDDQITPTSLPITAKASSTRSSCSSVWVAM